MAITIGQTAPDFTLTDSERNKVTLSEQRGNNVLLLFFPLAFSSVCTAELCSIRDNMSKYESLDARPFGISVDSFYALAKFKEEQGLNFTLLSDFNREASAAFGALYEDFYGMKGVSKRAAFLIDGAGVVQYAEVLENAGEQPNFSAIAEKLQSLTK